MMQEKSIEKISPKYRFLDAEAIKPKDDAYHGNINLFDVEWWYFDAVFDNDYSIHIGFRTYHIGKSGFLQSRINVYKGGKAQFEKLKINLFSNVLISEKELKIIINGQTVVNIDSDHYNKTGEWKYTIKLTIKDISIDLTFIGTTEGWKVETDTTCWTVALPKAKVEGYLKIGNKKLEAKGIGYHDHNWGYSASTAFGTIGWYWGRITGNNLNLTWAKTMKNIYEGDLLSILNYDKTKNTDEKTYYSIHPDDVIIKPKNIIKKKGKIIPTEFEIKIKSKNKDSKFPIEVDLKMNIIDIQHSRIFIANYWRYHVATSGLIKFDNISEILENKPQIIEFLCFKSKIYY